MLKGSNPEIRDGKLERFRKMKNMRVGSLIPRVNACWNDIDEVMTPKEFYDGGLRIRVHVTGQYHSVVGGRKFIDPIEKTVALAISSLPCTIHHLHDFVALRGAQYAV